MCVCCNRLMYRKTVQEFKVTNYGKVPEEFVVPESQSKQWICKTCHRALKWDVLPAQAKANNLELDDVPVELSDLNTLEVHLISLRIPLMKMVALPCGKQRTIHGPAINVPTDLTPVCTLLPRLPSQTQMVPMKLKRKLCYKLGTLLHFAGWYRLKVLCVVYTTTSFYSACVVIVVLGTYHPIHQLAKCSTSTSTFDQQRYWQLYSG